MKTPDFTAENLLGAIVNMGADPFIVETEEQAAQVAESINNSNGYDILTGDGLATAREQLDCPGARKVYAFVDGSGFIVCLSQDWDYMETMQDLADYINDCEDWPTNVEDIIEQKGWVNDTGEEWGVCHNDEETIYFSEDGKAICLYNKDLTYDVMFNGDTMSDTMGFRLSLQECKDFIAQYNGNPNVAYFGDYKGGIVQIINNESKVIVFSTKVI